MRALLALILMFGNDLEPMHDFSIDINALGLLKKSKTCQGEREEHYNR